MGMFDRIRCRAPLPGVKPDFVKGPDHVYQTKDTDSQTLDNYEISEDGILLHEEYDIVDRSDPNAEGLARLVGMMSRENERLSPTTFTGEITFYDSNVVGCHCGFWFTRTGEDREWVEYVARFADGVLSKPIEQIGYEREPALASEHMAFANRDMSPGPIRALMTPLIGQKLFQSFGVAIGEEPNIEEVEVVAEAKDDWCVLKANGRLQVIHRQSLGSTTFTSEDDARRHHAHRSAAFSADRKRYEELMAERKAKG